METEEKNKLAEERNNLQSVNIQLRNIARKYKLQLAEKTRSGIDNTDTCDKEVQCEDLFTAVDTASQNNKLLEEFQMKVQQIEEQNQNLSTQIERILQDNEILKKTANEKDENAKKIAQRARQRISEAIVEKNTLVREKETLANEIDALKVKILQLQTNDEQRTQFINQIRSQYDSKITQQDKDLHVANKQIENLALQLQQPSTSTSSSAPFLVSSTPVTTEASSVTPSGSTQARLSVPPQQQQQQSPTVAPTIAAVKPTPTASIKPLTVAGSRALSVSRTTNSGHRPVTMVQPTANAEDNSSPASIVSLPQATVQPTQPSSVSSTIPTSFEVSEASTSEIPSQPNPSLFAPSTSGLSGFSGEDKKRTFDSSDEPTSSNTKKFKIAISSDSSLAKIDESSSDIEEIISDSNDRNEAEVNVFEVGYDDDEQQQDHPEHAQSNNDEDVMEDDDHSDMEEDDIDEDESLDGVEERSIQEGDSSENEQDMNDEEEGNDELDEDQENSDNYDDDDDLELLDPDEESEDGNDADVIEVIAIDDSDEEEEEEEQNSMADNGTDQVSSSHTSTSKLQVNLHNFFILIIFSLRYWPVRSVTRLQWR